MFVSCPKCQTKFFIEEKDIGQSGRKVKCSECKHTWYQTCQKLAQDNPNNKPTPKEHPPTEKIASDKKPKVTAPKQHQIRHLPMVMPTQIQPTPYYFPIITFGLIVILMVILFPNSNYEKFFFKYKHLEVQDVSTKYYSSLQKFMINYKVQNNSGYEVQMPLIKSRLLKNSGEEITHSIDDHSSITIPPYKYVEIQTEFKPVPNNVYMVDLSIGRCFD